MQLDKFNVISHTRAQGSTRVGCITTRRSPPEEVDGAGLGEEREEVGPGPPEM